MSCVAELNASNQNNASVARKNAGAGTVNATEANTAPISNCVATIQSRFRPSSSTSGDHSGLITHGT